MSKAYSSNLIQPQFELIEPLIPLAKLGSDLGSLAGMTTILESGQSLFNEQEDAKTNPSLRPRVFVSS